MHNYTEDYMSKDKSIIRDIIYGKLGYKGKNYFENITYAFTQLQIANVNKAKVSCLCFELTGEILLEVRRLRAFEIELRNVYIYRYDEKSTFFAALKAMGVNLMPASEMYTQYEQDDILLNCWEYSVKAVDFKSFVYKANRYLNRRWPNQIKRHNPLGAKFDEKTVESGFWKNVRNVDFDRMLYYQNHITELEETFDMLEDEASKETFIEIIRAVCYMDDWRYEQGRPDQKYWEYYKHLEDECWVNCGAAYGDSIMWYLMNEYPYQYIDAYEGDSKTAQLLRDTISKAKVPVNIFEQYIGIGENTKGNFDDLYEKRRVTLINMDIEGAEINVLKGARKIIAEQKPVLAICAYHRPEDLIELPRLVKECSDDYVFYLKKYPCGSAGHVGEFVYYMIPKERING